MVYNDPCTYHIPVLHKEVLHGLDECLRRRGTEAKVVFDATAGGMGHSSSLASLLQKDDRLVSVDKDADAINQNKDKVGGVCQKIFVHDGFENITEILKTNDIGAVDAVLADLGVSSYQIDTASRGFSYTKDGPLDMRMDQSAKRDASHVVNNYTAGRLEEVIKTYGEERYAKSITSAIVAARPIETTSQLTKVITGAVPSGYYKTGGHPAKRTFQALRMEVNRELEVLQKFIFDAVKALKKGGRLAIITFHSLEDRIVKHTFKLLAANCICPPKTPKCICGHTASIKIITPKPILPTEQELRENPRSASAKLRIGEKI